MSDNPFRDLQEALLKVGLDSMKINTRVSTVGVVCGNGGNDVLADNTSITIRTTSRDGQPSEAQYNFNSIITEENKEETVSRLAGELVETILSGKSIFLCSIGMVAAGKSTLLYGPDTQGDTMALSLLNKCLIYIFSTILNSAQKVKVKTLLSAFDIYEQSLVDLLDPNYREITDENTDFVSIKVPNLVTARNIISLAKCHSGNWSDVNEENPIPPRPIFNVCASVFRITLMTESKNVSLTLMDVPGYSSDPSKNQLSSGLMELFNGVISTSRMTINDISEVTQNSMNSILARFVAKEMLNAKTVILCSIKDEVSDVTPFVLKTASDMTGVAVRINKDVPVSSRIIKVREMLTEQQMSDNIWTGLVKETRNEQRTFPRSQSQSNLIESDHSLNREENYLGDYVSEEVYLNALTKLKASEKLKAQLEEKYEEIRLRNEELKTTLELEETNATDVMNDLKRCIKACEAQIHEIYPREGRSRNRKSQTAREPQSRMDLMTVLAHRERRLASIIADIISLQKRNIDIRFQLATGDEKKQKQLERECSSDVAKLTNILGHINTSLKPAQKQSQRVASSIQRLGELESINTQLRTRYDTLSQNIKSLRSQLNSDANKSASLIVEINTFRNAYQDISRELQPLKYHAEMGSRLNRIPEMCEAEVEFEETIIRINKLLRRFSLIMSRDREIAKPIVDSFNALATGFAELQVFNERRKMQGSKREQVLRLNTNISIQAGKAYNSISDNILSLMSEVKL